MTASNDAVAAGDGNPAKGSPRIRLGALEAWMDAEGIGSGPIGAVSRLGGGGRNINARFRRAGRDLVLRMPGQFDWARNIRIRREMRLLKAIAGSAIPQPRLVAACEDLRVLGVPFYLMEPVDGFDPLAGLPHLHARSAAVRHRMGLALVEPIAALGSLDYVALGLSNFGFRDDFDAWQLRKWQGQLRDYDRFEGWGGPGLLGDVAGLDSWLDANLPAHFEPGIIHGDYHIANVMYRPDSGEIAAVVDWEMAMIGNPLFDLGWLVATWPADDGVVRILAEVQPGQSPVLAIQPWAGFPQPQELVDHYARHSARNLDSILWYVTFACYKLGVILEEAHARACAGRISSAVGKRLHERARFFFARAARWIDRGLGASSGS